MESDEPTARATAPEQCHCSSSRRRFLSGLLAAGATGLSACVGGVGARRPATRVDTHRHFFTPRQNAIAEKTGEANALTRSWSVARTLDDMDKAGIATSILSSVTFYTGGLSPAEARAASRDANEGGARLRSDHLGRFGLFASLPLQDTEGALREIEYALDILHADGILLHTNYGDKWLGHAQYAPVMDELNRRKAILYTHPQSASCCVNLQPAIPDSVIEFGADTTRAIVDIVFSGTAARCPDLRFIFSHAGGAMPYLSERLVRLPVTDPRLVPRVPRGVLTELRRFYYDTAWAANPMALSSLTRLVGISQVLLGSDHPYRTGEDNVAGLAACDFTPAELTAIERENAARLMPRLNQLLS